jgi:hypothetical protein
MADAYPRQEIADGKEISIMQNMPSGLSAQYKIYCVVPCLSRLGKDPD